MQLFEKLIVWIFWKSSPMTMAAVGRKEELMRKPWKKNAWFQPKLCIPFYNLEKVSEREKEEKREIEKQIIIHPQWKQLQEEFI